MPVARYAASLYDCYCRCAHHQPFAVAGPVPEKRADLFMTHSALALDIVNIIFSILDEVAYRRCFPACRVQAKLLLLYTASFKKV